MTYVKARIDFGYIYGTSVILPSGGNNDDNVVFVIETSKSDVAVCEEVIVLILRIGISCGVGLLV